VVPEFRSAYDHLSEVVHPNALGTTVYYTSLTSGVASFTDSGSGHRRALDYIYTSGVLLLVFLATIMEVDGMLKQLSADAAANANT
jgi:hypothetical protein